MNNEIEKNPQELAYDFLKDFFKCQKKGKLVVDILQELAGCSTFIIMETLFSLELSHEESKLFIQHINQILSEALEFQFSSKEKDEKSH